MKTFIVASVVVLVLIAGGIGFEQHSELKRQERQRHVSEIITIQQRCELFEKMDAAQDATRCRTNMNNKITEYGLKPTDFLSN